MIALINPNTSASVTATMVRIAGETAGPAERIEGFTAAFGATLITEPAELDRAAEAVAALATGMARARAVIVAAFGDPGLSELRARLSIPVTGIAEAGMAEAAQGGRRFAVVTTTPRLRERIAETAARHGHDAFIGTWTTPGDPVALTADADALRRALDAACIAAAEAGAEAIVIGGGPLAEAARDLAASAAVPLIEPLPAAVRLSLRRLTAGVSP
ncbi:aspartate/glutamate racemase family protein [Roseibacterium sp. SDUM158017]|uniref:aspartate/glutamate racemase family protein n=1 Tax=Roseicyclus salinarum TaxID=3036773 RepID=UPI0024154D57|nr:aspartate/glutamate racemase family protein [Roseibacterium sp. SDUM158017]MDG4650177.1 aspartate/glutamate racemase family protein [Roseibacterium sp. SDUM158017]